ncbi:L-threonylcarbamoyladenylate synthase [Pseudobacteriovorax antillogorgiicola]|uniref:Translation factor SUA5 n=1 Tax=Pseudobacteriovorax antillogorgiicola TaxID=1513793 RepID=A0A1Y6CB24_9BACT|nr:L-threonylcarbamoyladenylate synthase [Pseudobacteriovorax antillogorgiicola]TCS49490.1 translation factor SUA5 [Pseudobacteriovorax antillogorgiicola]SMF45964.1 translation factor SUA5 [Pseudobacteriovorax antillogorgiicola]
MSEHLYTYDDPPSQRDLDKACAVLEKGGVIGAPMGPNWSFCCDAANRKALDRIRRLKPSHPKDRPFALVCSDMAMASTVGNIDHQLYRYLKKAWPGPFTVIVKRNRSLPRQIKDKRQVVGIRIPKCDMILALVSQFGRPLASSSIPDQADGAKLGMGYQIFDTYGHGLDLLLDLGEELPCLESTVIDFSEGFPVLVREGEGDPSLFGELAEPED